MRTPLFLAVALAVGLTACDQQPANQPEPPAPTAAASAATPAPLTPAPAAAPATAPAAGQLGTTTDGTAPGTTSTGTPSTAQARVDLQPTQGKSTKGSLVLESGDGAGVRVHGTIEGLTPGATHGFHIHEKGDCSAPDAMSAGGHFNPDGKPHGDPAGEEHHVGDIFSVTADANGVGQVDARADRASLGDGAATDVLGKAVIVHEKADDYTTQPTGDAGGRIACGVIQ